MIVQNSFSCHVTRNVPLEDFREAVVERDMLNQVEKDKNELVVDVPRILSSDLSTTASLHRTIRNKLSINLRNSYKQLSKIYIQHYVKSSFKERLKAFYKVF